MTLSSRTMSGRRWGLWIAATVPLVAGAALAVPSTARADTGGYCLASGCNGLDPIKENCDVASTTVDSFTYTYSDGTSYEVDLRYSYDCEANWARVYTYKAEKFCVEDGAGYKQSYTSAGNYAASWTNMVDGSSSGDIAYLNLPSLTNRGYSALYADDTPDANQTYKSNC